MKNFLSIELKRIARKNFNPSKNARICSLHFKANDFVFDSADQQDRSKKKKNNKIGKKKVERQCISFYFEQIACLLYL